jgi:hypothetical protein
MMMPIRLLVRSAALATTLTIASVSLASADTISFSDIARGRYSTTSNIGNAANNFYGTGYFNGGSPNSFTEWRSWFAFDLAGMGGTITAAALQLNAGTYTSPDASETYELHQVTTAVNVLGSSLNNGAIFTDLGDGPVYGTHVFNASQNNATQLIVLNAAAITDIQSALGQRFALGGLFTTLSSNDSITENAMFGTQANVSLILTRNDPQAVPEPATLGLVATGLISLMRRRRRQIRG